MTFGQHFGTQMDDMGISTSEHFSFTAGVFCIQEAHLRAAETRTWTELETQTLTRMIATPTSMLATHFIIHLWTGSYDRLKCPYSNACTVNYWEVELHMDTDIPGVLNSTARMIATPTNMVATPTSSTWYFHGKIILKWTSWSLSTTVRS